MGWVEDVKVSVFGSPTAEIGGRVCFCIKWGGIFSFSFTLHSNQVSFFLHHAKTDVLGNFWLILLIQENKGVMTSVTSVKEGQSFSRVSGVL